MKILNKFIKISGLAAICGLFGLGCLVNNQDQTKTYEVSAADSNLIFNDSEEITRLQFGVNQTLTNDFRNIDLELNVNQLYENSVFSYLYSITIDFNGINTFIFTYNNGDDDGVVTFTFSNSVTNSFTDSVAYDRVDLVLGSSHMFTSSILGKVIDYNFEFNFYINDVLEKTYNCVYQFTGVVIGGADSRHFSDSFYDLAPYNDTFISFAIDTTSLTSYAQGYSDGYNAGYTNGYNDGNSQGYSNGYSQGYSEGVDSQQQNITDAYNNGYSAGYNEGFSADSTATTIFSGILQVALVPINFFLAIFNFDILGINLAAFIKALFTIAITIIVIKAVMGGKGASED